MRISGTPFWVSLCRSQEYGRTKIKEAQKNSQWDMPNPPTVTDEQTVISSDLLSEYELAYTNNRIINRPKGHKH